METSEIIPQEVVESKILFIRGKKVMLDKDLASLYGVETKMLNRAIKRNQERFPDDFMFQLSKDELENLRYHFGTSSWGGQRYLPYAFTENGVAMLSSVLNSKRAIQVNMQIMRTFTKIRELLLQHKDLSQRLDELENKYDAQFKVVFDAIRQLMVSPEKKKKIGFMRACQVFCVNALCSIFMPKAFSLQTV
ncbi:MAG: ORF6N domain-containing protein [Nitrospiraceae bacterium]|nr:MAG: ORF6N domain-containing protein [Nitrospiraceae bacterium]